MPNVTFTTPYVLQKPTASQWKLTVDMIKQTLVKEGGADPAHIDICPGFGQLRRDSRGVIDIDISWVTGRKLQQKQIIEDQIKSVVSRIYAMAADRVNVTFFEGDAKYWMVRGELGGLVKKAKR